MSVPAIPVGTIVAYSGPVETDIQKAALSALGWLLCDGSSLPKQSYANLAIAIGTAYGGTGGPSGNFNLPDLRGRFQRGATYGTTNDPDAAGRIASNPGGNVGNQMGTLQGYATARPNIPFITSQDGLHQHWVKHAPKNNNAYAVMGSHYSIWNDGHRSTREAGDHVHYLYGGLGWDQETRPLNIYLNFIIKYKDS